MVELIQSAITVDHWDIAKIAEGIIRLTGDDAYAEMMRSRAKSELEKVSWKNSAVLIREIYRDIAHQVIGKSNAAGEKDSLAIA